MLENYMIVRCTIFTINIVFIDHMVFDVSMVTFLMTLLRNNFTNIVMNY
jgi:hypothetical protein